MRGEEKYSHGRASITQELPPHARRRDELGHASSRILGITSACAEKRSRRRSSLRPPRNYLRMRGEESKRAFCGYSMRELPPHARRRARLGAKGPPALGITSACAEKSYRRARGSCRPGNYLRMRGEEFHLIVKHPIPQELPPHARRRDVIYTDGKSEERITSACAEKRPTGAYTTPVTWNYLRMRGEELVSNATTSRS